MVVRTDHVPAPPDNEAGLSSWTAIAIWTRENSVLTLTVLCSDILHCVVLWLKITIKTLLFLNIPPCSKAKRPAKVTEDRNQVKSTSLSHFSSDDNDLGKLMYRNGHNYQSTQSHNAPSPTCIHLIQKTWRWQMNPEISCCTQRASYLLSSVTPNSCSASITTSLAVVSCNRNSQYTPRYWNTHRGLNRLGALGEEPGPTTLHRQVSPTTRPFFLSNDTNISTLTCTHM